MDFLKPTSGFPFFTPLESPSVLFSVALKLFELLTYKFVTFPEYDFYTFSKIFRTIIVSVNFSCLSWHCTLVWISPHDRAPGRFGQGIIVIKLILVDFDGHNAYFTLIIFTYVVYMHVYVM